MRILRAVIIGGALVLGAAAAQAETGYQLQYGQTQYPTSTMYSSAYGDQVALMPPGAFNPDATIGGTTVNASAIGGGAEIHMMSGRAATFGAAPAPAVRPR